MTESMDKLQALRDELGDKLQLLFEDGDYSEYDLRGPYTFGIDYTMGRGEGFAWADSIVTDRDDNGDMQASFVLPECESIRLNHVDGVSLRGGSDTVVLKSV